MKTCFYRYIVTYWDDFDECNKTSSGFVEGAKYSDVVDKLASFFGEENLNSIDSLYPTAADCGILEDETIQGVYNSCGEEEDFK